MTLAQMESRFFELKGKLAVGQIGEDEFKREMEKLRFQDVQGRWWMIGAQSGRWYFYDGSRWLLGQPPAEEPQPPASLPEREAGEPPRPAAPVVAPIFTPPAAPPPPAPPPAANVPPPPPASPFPPAVQPPAPPVRVTENAAPPARTGIPARLKEPTPRGPTLADRVRQEMEHVHVPEVHAPQVHVPDLSDVHVPEVHAPQSLQRYSPRFILAGAVVVGLVIVALMWLAVDNLIPNKPISSFLGSALTGGKPPTPSIRATGTPLGGANVEALLSVSDDLVSESQFASALAAYQNAARVAPNNAEVYTHWARALALAGRIQDAVDNARRATRIDPTSSAAFAELARALAWSGQADEAVTSGQKAVELDDKNATAHAFLAEALLRAGKPGDADKEAARAVQIDDKSADAHRAAGWVAILGKKQDVALEEWKRVVELAPDMFFYHYEFGQVYGNYLNDSTNAVPEYQKAITLFAPYVPSYIALGRTYLAQNQPGPAILQFQKALTFDPNSNEAFVGLGIAFQKQGRCAQAIPYFQKSLEANKQDADAVRGMADCGALAQGQATPSLAVPTPGLGAVPTAIVQATVVPLAAMTPTPKVAPASAATSAPAGPVGPGRIAFSVFDGQNYHLYVANADGSSRKQLPDKDAIASEPAFSPDGSQLLYYSWSKEQRGIHRMEANGGGDEAVSLRIEDVLPSWSPDGTQFIYTTRAGQGADIGKRSYRLRLSDPTARPGQDPPDFTVGQYPSWGPTGKIAYRDCGLPTETCGLAVIDNDGSNKRSLTNINSTAPAWSRDGKYVAFMSDYGGNWDVYIIAASGGSPARLTTDPAEDGLPTFSPDGKQIAYVSHRSGKWEIWAMGIDGSNQHKLFDLGGELAGNVAGNSAAQPGQQWWEQRISWGK